MRFMKLADKYSKEDSKFQILPIAYEKDLTYGAGASKGPKEIIKASEHLEYYDEQFDVEPFENGVHTLPSLQIKDLEPKEAMDKITEAIPNKFTISLGGDHSITIGAVKGTEKHHEDFSVITLDAHTDLFHSWNNSQYNHRCVSQRVSQNHKVLLIGIRSMDKDEMDIIKTNDNVDMITAYDYTEEKVKEILPKLKDKVYISIDVDVFDPAFIRNTGTPEPGGLTWYQVIDILKLIFKEKQVIGADIVEFSPKTNFDAEAFSLAKLAYKIMALKQ